MGFAECGDGVDAEVSGLCGGLCCDCDGCGDFGFGCGALAVVGVGALCGDAGLYGGEAFVAGGSGLVGGDGGVAGLVGFEVVAVADDDGGADEKEEAGGYQGFGAAAGSAPLFEGEAPEGGEEDDAGHVEGPAGEVVLAHLGLAHGVEEELEVPDDACERGEEVVGDEGAGGMRSYGGGGRRGIEVDEGVAGGVGGAHGVVAGFADELADGVVFEDEDC